MKILPIAFDSLGVRSMATYVETSDDRIFIDPGVSVSPDRFSLPPHRIELDRHREMWQSITRWVDMSDVVVITHYHFDHVRDIPLIGMNFSHWGTIEIYSIPPVFEVVSSHLIDGKIYPNFLVFPKERPSI